MAYTYTRIHTQHTNTHTCTNRTHRLKRWPGSLEWWRTWRTHRHTYTPNTQTRTRTHIHNPHAQVEKMARRFGVVEDMACTLHTTHKHTNTHMHMHKPHAQVKKMARQFGVVEDMAYTYTHNTQTHKYTHARTQSARTGRKDGQAVWCGGGHGLHMRDSWSLLAVARAFEVCLCLP